MSVALWRIATDAPEYTSDDMTGEGARRSGARWNRIGSPVVYTSTSIALACLETVVHLAGGDLPLNRYLLRIDIPDDIWLAAIVLDPAKHVGWDAEPPGKVSLNVGEQWLAAKASLLLSVPSVIVPEERNVLINPAHPDISRAGVSKLRRWYYSARLR